MSRFMQGQLKPLLPASDVQSAGRGERRPAAPPLRLLQAPRLPGILPYHPTPTSGSPRTRPIGAAL